MKLYFTIVAALLIFSNPLHAQKSDEEFFKDIYEEALVRGHAYQNLRSLCKDVGPRLSGSPQAAAAVEWGRLLMKEYNFDTVYLQPVMVTHWERGEKEHARTISDVYGTVELNVTALGNSSGSGSKGVSGHVVEVSSLEEIEELGKEAIEGKIVFINQVMPLNVINTFAAYSKTAIIRSSGPSKAANYGAVGVVIRSLGMDIDDYPHTGSTRYNINTPKIPAVAVSTADAEKLSEMIENDQKLKINFETHCEMYDDVLSYNVIGELTGRTFPQKIITVGGHLDSWDLAEGAHDDGAGVIHSIEVLRILKEMNYDPRHTIRVVLFMNEENGLKGGKEYARVAKEKSEEHIAAVESDNGGFIPRGFTVDADPAVVDKIVQWDYLFKPFGVHEFKAGFGGADISPLKNQGIPLLGFRVDTQRYFKVHHSGLDTFESVDRRELEMGAATLTAMIYLIDKYGLETEPISTE